MINVLALAKQTLQNPRAGFRGVLNSGLPNGAAMAALTLMAVTSALLAHLGLRLSPMQPSGNPIADQMMQALFATPFTTAGVQVLALFMGAAVIHFVGRAWGGVGRFDGAVLAVVWLHVFLLTLQMLQMLTFLLIPQMVGLFGPVSLVLLFWLLTQFVAELHGFKSAPLVLLGIVMTMFAVSFLAVFAIVAILGPEGLPRV